MQIKIRYFASLREITGRGEELLDVPDGATVAMVRELLSTRYSTLQPILSRCIYAVNRAYVQAETPLNAQDEVVFIPPMGGGSQEEKTVSVLVQLTHQPLERDVLVQAVSHPSVGGIVVFEGVVRDHARGKQVRYLEYETYEEMAEQQIHAIIAEARTRWDVKGIAVAHRFGRLEIGEASVIIVVASAHRGEAFDACRYMIDTLKTTVPIWKKEVATNGEEWVEG
ncbi:MAG TPA: molybdopterin converting factor subunit 1 [Ktedonobacteraceae bacterium]|jgi:molybdopterin synthase catalytic subunit|nr:molybdopterin converting factor subunit 1 [Ktedonobacteraceae bacterium]